MKLVTAATMRELDRRTIDEYGVSGEELMDRAGQGVAYIIRRMTEVAGLVQPRILLLAGRGNNGGDAFTAARHLHGAGFPVEVWLAGAANQVKGDALKQLSRMRAAKVPLEELPTREDWDAALAVTAASDVLVDGLLGTGSQGLPRGPVAGAIEFINANRRDAIVVAIDVPSGLDSDSGGHEGAVVLADLTISMALPKVGMVQPEALGVVGAVEVIDIGVPPEFVEEAAGSETLEAIHPLDLKPLFPPRPRASHKGDYGHVLLLGGARGYTGAMALAARAAGRSGVGLVTAVVPGSLAPIVAAHTVESMIHGAPENDAGALAAEGLAPWLERLDAFDAVLAGPGMTTHPDTLAIVEQLIGAVRVPLVLDADALNVLPGRLDLLKRASAPIVLTPHPGELGRLLEVSTKTIQDLRLQSVRKAVEATGATVILKGAGTLVAGPGQAMTHINLSGNPGMATGGAGDVLAGLLAGLLAQGLPPMEAARSAVYLHGRAGDMAAWRKSQAGLVAGDLVEEMPYVFRELSIR